MLALRHRYELVKRQLYYVGLVAIGSFGFASLGLGQGHGHHGSPFSWSGNYRGPASYDFESYPYQPSAEQVKVAKKEVAKYLEAVQKNRRGPAKQRCISVVTLPPTKAQGQAYLKKRAEAVAKGAQLASSTVKPEQLQCLMVFDVQNKQFVGSGCYIVESLPSKESVAQFEGRTAEFVGQ